MDDKQTYTANARRANGWWAIDVHGLKGVFSQARRLDQVEAMARDAIAAMLDVPPDSFDVYVHVELVDRLLAEVEQAQGLRRDADRRQQEASEAMRQVVDDLVDTGLTVRDAGHVLGVSYQRVAQLRRRGRRRQGEPAA